MLQFLDGASLDSLLRERDVCILRERPADRGFGLYDVVEPHHLWKRVIVMVPDRSRPFLYLVEICGQFERHGVHWFDVNVGEEL